MWTILVHDLSVFHCDVEYIGFGNAVFGVFFQAQALRPEWPRQHPVQSHVQQRRADPHLKQLLSSSVNILAVALGLANGSECMDGCVALRCLSRTPCCIASAGSGRRQVCFVEWGCRKVAARVLLEAAYSVSLQKGHHLSWSAAKVRANALLQHETSFCSEQLGDKQQWTCLCLGPQDQSTFLQTKA